MAKKTLRVPVVKQPTLEQFEDIARHAAESGAFPECVICGEAADMIGVFIPRDPQEFGAPVGQDRTIMYGACDACRSKSGSNAKFAEDVEAAIQRSLGKSP